MLCSLLVCNGATPVEQYPAGAEHIVLPLSRQMTAVEQARKMLEDQLAMIDALPPALLRHAFAGEL